MDIIDEKEFNKTEIVPSVVKKSPEETWNTITDDQFEVMLDDMKNPVDAQRRLAVQVKAFLDTRIDAEMESKGILSDHTRRWVETYTNLLEKIQKALYGEKSVNLNLKAKISHSQVASLIRGAKKNDG